MGMASHVGETIPGAPHRRYPSRASTLYLAASVLLLAVLALTAAHGEWVSDTWIHSATLSEVSRHPLHPLEPLTGEDAPFAYFSPWAMLLGWLMRATGLPVFPVLTAAGLIDTALLLAAWYRLTRALSRARWAPPLALALLLLLWGSGTWFWSGFPSLGTLTVGFTWPSVLAAAGWFQLWRCALQLDTLGWRRVVPAFALLPGLILLTHPFTAVLAAASVGVTLLGRTRTAPRRVTAAAAASLVSVLLATVWPWIDLRAMIGDPARFDAIHHPLYRDLGHNLVLLLLTVPVLIWRLRADRADPLFWTAALCGAGVAVGGLTGTWSLGRLTPAVALPGQLALAVALAGSWTQRARLTRPRPGPSVRPATALLAVLTCLALVVGGDANGWALARAWPDDHQRGRFERATDAPPPYPHLSWISSYVSQEAVVLSNSWLVRRQLPTYGLRTVEPAWPSPGVPDEARRIRDVPRILGLRPVTTARRRRLLAHYQIRWIVWLPAPHAPQWPFPSARLVTCGPQRLALLLVDPAVGRRPAACPV